MCGIPQGIPSKQKCVSESLGGRLLQARSRKKAKLCFMRGHTLGNTLSSSHMGSEARLCFRSAFLSTPVDKASVSLRIPKHS